MPGLPASLWRRRCKVREARRVLLACWLSLISFAACANTPLGEPALEEHVNRLASELRCLVCQNQTIADSQADLALQLKGEVRRQLQQGASDVQIREFMVQRYGDYVLYRPPVNKTTWLLWFGPALLLTLGGALLGLHVRDRRRAFQGQPDSVLPPDEDGPFPSSEATRA